MILHVNTCFSCFLINFSHYLRAFWTNFASKERKPMINFTDLYDKTIDDLFTFGTKFTTDREMIKDCIQDVFVKLYTKKDELGSVSNIESYLYVSLRNRINDEFRRNTHISDNEINENHMKSISDDSEAYDMERIEEETKKSCRLKEFVGSLSPRQQQIIRLYYVEQRKYDDICRIMGINYQSVRNLMHRSLLKLRFMAARTSTC